MAKRKKYINPPTLEDERELLDTVDNVVSKVDIRGKSFSFRMLTGFAQHKITQILVGNGDDAKVSCKCVAAAWLNGFFSLKFFWWIVWRWFYYIRQYTEDDLGNAVALIKKKIPLAAYSANTILWIGMRETMMQMNKNEVYLILREHSTDSDGKSARNGHG